MASNSSRVAISRVPHNKHPTSTCYSLQEKLLCPCGGRRKRRRGWGGMDSMSLTFVKLVHSRHELFHVGFCSVYIYSCVYSSLFIIIHHYSSLFIIIHHYSSLFIIIHLYSYTCTCICNPEDMAGRCPFASVIPFKDLQPFVAAVQKTLRSYEVIFHDIFCEIPTWVTTYRSSTLRWRPW